MRILLVEDDVKIAQNLQTLLQQAHYLVDHVTSVDKALVDLSSGDYDLAIIDWMLPDGEGIEIIQALREEQQHLPILMLTARTQIDDLVEGLEVGADDYLTKPFRTQELLVRISALLRRRKQSFTTPTQKIGILILDTKQRQVLVNQKEVSLSPKEYDLLAYLASSLNEPVERLKLLSHVWGNDVDAMSNTVDVHIRYLRKKLGPAAKYIQTVKGVGYKLCEKSA